MRLIEGGCDPMLVARRLVIHSAEDVGMADPRALQIAASAMYAFEKIGCLYRIALFRLADVNDRLRQGNELFGKDSHAGS